MLEYEIVLGKSRRGEFLRFGGSEHVALHARSGAGKTSSFTIPNCFAWPGSLVVLDVKREAFIATAGHRAAIGQSVARNGRNPIPDRTAISAFCGLPRIVHDDPMFAPVTSAMR